MSSILILCRGNSLSRINEITQEFDLYGIVNEWNSQLKEEKFIDLLFNKKIIHYINRDISTSILDKSYYNAFNIEYCQTNVMNNEYQGSEAKVKLDNMGVKSKPLCDGVIQHSIDGEGGFPSNGMTALVHSVVCLGCEDVTVIGMDFFQDNYYTHHSSMGGKNVRDYQVKKNKIMIPFLTDFIKKNNNVNFNFYTNSDFNPKLKNVKIHRREENE